MDVRRGVPDVARARTARHGRILAAGMLAGALLTLVAFGIDVAPMVGIGLVLGALAWLAVPFWVLTLGRSLRPSLGNAASNPTPAAEWSDT